MHEMGIVQSIMEIIEEHARANQANKILSVKLEFGALTAVMPSAVTFAFEVLSQGGMAEGARVDIEIIPVKVFCLECGTESVLEQYQPFCPVCSSPAARIIQGRDEMRVVELEIE